MTLRVTPNWRRLAFAFVATAFVAACASVNGLAPTASMRDVNGLAAQRALEGAAVGIDEAGDLEIIRHVRDNTHGCVASSRGGS